MCVQGCSGETSCKQTSGRTESSFKEAGEKFHRVMGVPGEKERGGAERERGSTQIAPCQHGC